MRRSVRPTGQIVHGMIIRDMLTDDASKSTGSMKQDIREYDIETFMKVKAGLGHRFLCFGLVPRPNAG